jgi:hypothetical protein
LTASDGDGHDTKVYLSCSMPYMPRQRGRGTAILLEGRGQRVALLVLTRCESMGQLFKTIQQLVAEEKYVVGQHASEQLEERGIMEW